MTSQILRRSSPVTAFLAVLFITRAAGHGFMYKPMSRNIRSYYYDGPSTKESTPQGLDAGTGSTVSRDGAYTWPAGVHSACGDLSGTRYMTPGPVMMTYTAGQVIDIQVAMTMEHMGRFAFRLCTDPNPTNACFEQASAYLTRADPVLPGGKFWYLTSNVSPDGSYQQIPYPGPTAFYTGTKTYQLQFKLPAGVTCEHCVLQWLYTTGNSCTPPCDKADPYYPNCDPTHKGICGQSGAVYPEEFWNCADIRITGGGSSTSSPPPPPQSGCTRSVVVKSGDSCWAISQAAGISLSTLQSFNPNAVCSNLQIGQSLCVAGGDSGGGGCSKKVVVKSGDTCWAISQAAGTTVGALQSANPSMNCSNLQIGQSVCLP